jgi:hypothetical protein
MAHFKISDDDMFSDDSIMAAVLENQTNRTPSGKKVALRTSAATSPVAMRSLTTWDQSRHV